MNGFTKNIACQANDNCYTHGCGADYFPYGHNVTLRTVLRKVAECEVDYFENGVLICSEDGNGEPCDPEECSDFTYLQWTFEFPAGTDCKRIAEHIGYFRYRG